MAWWTKWTKGNVRAALADVGAVAVTTDTGDGAGGAGVGRCRTTSTTRRRARRAGRRRAGVAAAGARPDDHGVEGAGAGTSVRTGRRCSTATATPGRRCGSVGGRSARGVSSRAAPSSPGCSRTSTPRTAIRIDAAAQRLTEWMDGVRVTPRFPTPLDRELAAGHGVVPSIWAGSSRNPGRSRPETDRAQIGDQRTIVTPARASSASAAAPSPALTSTGAVAARGTTQS